MTAPHNEHHGRGVMRTRSALVDHLDDAVDRLSSGGLYLSFESHPDETALTRAFPPATPIDHAEQACRYWARHRDLAVSLDA